MKRQKPTVGQVFITPHGKYQIFTVIATERHFDIPNPEKFLEILKKVAVVINHKKVPTLRIARTGELTDSYLPGLWIDIIKSAFKNTRIDITLCMGKIEVPKPQERKEIIQNFHSSLTSGHRGRDTCTIPVVMYET